VDAKQRIAVARTAGLLRLTLARALREVFGLVTRNICDVGHTDGGEQLRASVI
jgi:hypothetical protein